MLFFFLSILISSVLSETSDIVRRQLPLSGCINTFKTRGPFLRRPSGSRQRVTTRRLQQTSLLCFPSCIWTSWPATQQTSRHQSDRCHNGPSVSSALLRLVRHPAVTPTAAGPLRRSRRTKKKKEKKNLHSNNRRLLQENLHGNSYFTKYKSAGLFKCINTVECCFNLTFTFWPLFYFVVLFLNVMLFQLLLIKTEPTPSFPPARSIRQL